LIVTTTKGEMDDSLLEKREGDIDNNNETTTWTEYWLEGELVHRSVHVTLKKMPPVGGETGNFERHQTGLNSPKAGLPALSE